MPKNLSDYMNRNNISESSRNSRDDRQIGVGNGPAQKFSRFPKSKEECTDEMTKLLYELDKKDEELKRVANTHATNSLRKFNEDYDNLAQQILRYVELRLKENKEKVIREIKQRRNADMAECKPIARNVNELRLEVSSLRDGLSRSTEYRTYMSKIILKDFDEEIRGIQYNIDHLRFPGVEVKLDQKYNACFRSDLEKLIYVKDEMGMRTGPQNGMLGDEVNSHTNRDEIKRTKPSFYK